jgi:diguanylate cyclase (GGDEF)-like protein
MARSAIGVSGIVLVLTHPDLAAHPSLAMIAFILILSTALAQALVLGDKWQKIEEAVALPAILIVGFGGERVDILTLLWLGAVSCGVLARGGRVHWIGSVVVMSSLALPIVLTQQLSLAHAAFSLTVIALLLTCGRVTQELRLLLARARWDADHDNLTGVLAPLAFRERLDVQTPDGEGALLLIDLDSFGQINKNNGHAAGDQVLARVGTVLQEQAGEDALVARLGGDEFGVATRADDPAELAKRIVSALGATPTNVPASVGMAAFPRDGHNADALLRAADIALRIAKRAGRQQISAYAGDSLSDQGPGGARAALMRLIEGENLAIFVQPIVDVETGRYHAFEALARFQTGSTSSPLHWFALAEEFGLRPELELACLRSALGLLEELPHESLLSVNLSGPLLLDPRTLALFMDAPDISRLIVELTENTLVEETPELHAAMAELRGRGVELAIDDMGAGYSGLRQITAVQAGYLKLDRSLVSGVDCSPERQALIAALLSYSQRMNGAIVAEGVETEDEFRAIRELGVPLVQGYLLGRPNEPWPDTSHAPRAAELLAS